MIQRQADSTPPSSTDAAPARVLILDAAFYADIARPLLAGATAAFDAAGVSHRRVEVPGILELPAALLFATGEGPRNRYDGYVLLGCAIKGETDHYEHVCHQAMTGIQRVTLARGLAVGNGILTCPTQALAAERADPAGKNHGGQAARACLRMIQLHDQFDPIGGLSHDSP